MFVSLLHIERPSDKIYPQGEANKCSKTEVVHMKKEEYKKYIIEMIQKIENVEHLERIFNYVHRFFIRRTGE